MKINLLALVALLLSMPPAGSDVSIIQRFLPTDAHICSLRTADVASGHIIGKRPAVLRGNLIPNAPSTIVAAYSTAPEENCRGLKVLLLEQDNNEWKAAASLSFPDEYLWMEQGKTNGLQIRRIPGSTADVLVLITSRGAALGARIQILRWDSSARTFVNLVPADAEGTSFEMLEDGSLVIHEKRKKSVKYSFNGTLFARTP